MFLYPRFFIQYHLNKHKEIKSPDSGDRTGKRDHTSIVTINSSSKFLINVSSYQFTPISRLVDVLYVEPIGFYEGKDFNKDINLIRKLNLYPKFNNEPFYKESREKKKGSLFERKEIT